MFKEKSGPVDDAIEAIDGLAGVNLPAFAADLSAKTLEQIKPALNRAKAVLAFMHGLAGSLNTPGKTSEETAMELKLAVGGVLAAGRSGGAPAGRSRNEILLAAKQGYRDELASGRVVICTMKSFCSEELRQAGLPGLTASEAVAWGISDDRNKADLPQRHATIAAARQSFAAEMRRGVTVLCSEHTWVAQSLREAGLAELTREECDRVGLDPADDFDKSGGDDSDDEGE